MDELTISSIIVGGVGVLLIIISVLFFLHSMRTKKKCSSQTMGTVIDYRCSRFTGETSIAPVTEFFVNGERYIAYRHYKGVVSSSKAKSIGKETMQQQSCDFYISDSDWFHKSISGGFSSLSFSAGQMWPIGTKMPVVYNPDNPKQSYVEKVVVISNIVGTILLAVGMATLLLSVLFYVLK